MLEGVVGKEGTAPEAKIAGYRVAGKTGTADRYDAARRRLLRQDRQLHRLRPGRRPRDRRGRHAAAADQGLLRRRGRRPGVPRRDDLRAPGAADPADRHQVAGGQDPRRRRPPPPSDTSVIRDRRSGAAGASPLTVGSLSVSSPRPSSLHATALAAVAARSAVSRPASDRRGHRGHPRPRRTSSPGDLYAALPGANAHGARYAAAARDAGAVAVLTDAAGADAPRRRRGRPAARRRRATRAAVVGPGGLAGLRHGRPRPADVRRDGHQRQDHDGLPRQLGAHGARPHDRADRHGRDADRRRAGQERPHHARGHRRCTPCWR